MRKNIFYTLLTLALAVLLAHASAATTSVATVPDGMMTFAIPQGVITNLSLPLTKGSTYTGVVASVNTSTLSVDDSPPPFSNNGLSAASAPYFVKMLTGNEAGRVMLINGNTTNGLTVDTTDHATGAAVSLTTTGCAVQAGDAFEVFPGETIATLFGTGSGMLLTGAANISSADNVQIYSGMGSAPAIYYYNTTAGFWERTGTAVNANNTVLFPYAAFGVSRRAGHGDTNLVLGGRVTNVEANTKVVSRAGVYTSSHFATDVKLSQLHFGSNWLTGFSAPTADALSVWNSTTEKFDMYFQKPDSTWRKSTDLITDVSSVTIAAGSVTGITKRQPVTGATSFVQCPLPYSLK